MTYSDRGKQAEAKLKTLLKTLEATRHDLCFEKIPDARSARGAMSNPRDGDFVIYSKGCNILIECKEVDHEFRLPCANFDRGQRGRMMKRQLAGSLCYVFVFHSPTELWRILPLNYFGTQDTGSWDLSTQPTVTKKELSKCILALIPIGKP